jgi:predicted RNA-binding Zn-ribbon protein involved in translation (DUF1610 family)|tara:strand:+ start:1617 stop:1760 length:144 start_codon:yes stop_codon:yes gene_type:complete
MILLLRCPKCGNKMKYQAKDMILTGKRKRCVYCGFSMSAGKCIIKKV